MINKKQLNLPKMDLIEHTALNFALTFYEGCRNQGMKSKYKTARLYALHNYQKFLAKAIETLQEMLGRDDIHENVKEKIYEAVMTRVNDPEVNQIFPMHGAIPELDLEKILKGVPDKPVVVLDFKRKRSLKSRLKEGVAH